MNNKSRLRRVSCKFDKEVIGLQNKFAKKGIKISYTHATELYVKKKRIGSLNKDLEELFGV
jgi:hypothetical protein|tara:strand:- start:701 stop:883 length:183 start_codon:yes stop_codon:yes gene_type:complete